MESEFWAALVGAIVGGAIAFVVQLIVLLEGRRQRAFDAQERKVTLAHTFLFKLVKVRCHYAFLKDLIDRQREVGDQLGGSREPWQYLAEMPTAPPPVVFAYEELNMLVSLGEPGLLNELHLVDEMHNSTLNVLAHYGRVRSELIATFPADVEGATGWISKEDIKKILPRTTHVNVFAHELIENVEAGDKATDKLLEDVSQAFRKHLKIRLGIERVGLGGQSRCPPPPDAKGDPNLKPKPGKHTLELSGKLPPRLGY